MFCNIFYILFSALIKLSQTLSLFLSFNFLCLLPFNTLRNLLTNSMCSNTQIYPILQSLTASFRLTQKLRSVLWVKKIPPEWNAWHHFHHNTCSKYTLVSSFFILFFHFCLELTLLVYFIYNNDIKETCLCLWIAYKEQACHPLLLKRSSISRICQMLKTIYL